MFVHELAVESNEDSEKSTRHVEKKLREENMILRQEIIKLKRALYMNYSSNQQQQIISTIQNSTDQMPELIQAQSPKHKKQSFLQTSDEQENMMPLQMPP